MSSNTSQISERISKEQRPQRKHHQRKKKVQISCIKQGRKNAKGDGKAKENAQSEGRTKEMMDEDKETDEVGLSTEDEVSTAKKGVEIFKGTEDQREGIEEKVESTHDKGSLKTYQDFVIKIKRFNEHFISTGSAKDERFIKQLNKKRSGLSKSEVIKEDTKEEVKDEDKDEESVPRKESRKYPIIDWKTECLGTKPQPDEAKTIEEINLNVVTRSNGQQRHFSVLTSVLSIFDREVRNAVYQLVNDNIQDEDGLKVLKGSLGRFNGFVQS
ncbi:hypothetical protein Tco_1109059 [Tanacetum coccineum]